MEASSGSILHKSQLAHERDVYSTFGRHDRRNSAVVVVSIRQPGAPIVPNASYDVPSFDVAISSVSLAFPVLGIVANLLEKYVLRHVLQKKKNIQNWHHGRMKETT